MLDDTLLLTVYDLVFVIMTSCAHCHIIIHIQSYRYNHTHTIMQYTYKQTHTIMQWCCTRVYETFLWKAVPIPGLCACHRCSSADWLSDPWSLRLPPVQFTGSLVKTFVSAPATLQLTRLILKMMVSAPATGGVQGIDCQIPGLCVCHLCSLPDWWLDPWSLRCACHLAVYQVDFQNVGVRACHRWSSADWLSDPWSACHPCNLREWWLDQVASNQFSAPATRAVDRIDFQTVGLCARHRCSLPS